MKSGADPGAEKEKEKEKEKNEDEESPEKPSKVRSGQATESKLASDGVTTGSSANMNNFLKIGSKSGIRAGSKSAEESLGKWLGSMLL